MDMTLMLQLDCQSVNLSLSFNTDLATELSKVFSMMLIQISLKTSLEDVALLCSLHTYLPKLSCENLIASVAINQSYGLSWRFFILGGEYSGFVIPAGPFSHLGSPCSLLSFPETT